MTDLHRQRAAEIFGVPYEQVTDAQRKYAKVVYFAQDYSVSDSLQQKLDQMKEEASARDNHGTARAKQSLLDAMKERIRARYNHN